MKIKFIHLFIYLVTNLIRIFKLTEFYQPTYNPKNLYYFRGSLYERLSNERIDVIKANIDLSKVSTYLDIGSQLGYFVYKINETNNSIFSTGIEMNKVSYVYSLLIGILNNSTNTSFVNTELTSETVKNIHCFDVISCFFPSTYFIESTKRLYTCLRTSENQRMYIVGTFISIDGF